MKLAIMQPYFCPYIGYFQLMHAVDRFVVYDDVNYIKKGWINRNRILVNNTDYMFTVPLQNASQNRLIRETEIVDDNSWRNTLLETIGRAYKKAPQFTSAFEIVRKIVIYPDRNLAGFITHSLKIIAAFLDLKCIIIESSSVYGNRELKGQERIVYICSKEKADEYYNAIGGTELYDPAGFADKRITLRFVKPRLTEYRQTGYGFIQGLSIIDVMMWNNPDVVRSMVASYELVLAP